MELNLLEWTASGVLNVDPELDPVLYQDFSGFLKWGNTPESLQIDKWEEGMIEMMTADGESLFLNIF